MIQAMVPDAPRPGCMACGQAQLHLRVNTETMTLGELIAQVRGVGGCRWGKLIAWIRGGRTYADENWWVIPVPPR